MVYDLAPNQVELITVRIDTPIGLGTFSNLKRIKELQVRPS